MEERKKGKKEKNKYMKFFLSLKIYEKKEEIKNNEDKEEEDKVHVWYALLENIQ